MDFTCVIKCSTIQGGASGNNDQGYPVRTYVSSSSLESSASKGGPPYGHNKERAIESVSEAWAASVPLKLIPARAGKRS